MRKQQEFVLQRLKNKERVTALTMFPHGVTRLSNVILKLRNKGHQIETETYLSDGVSYASYVLPDQKVTP